MSFIQISELEKEKLDLERQVNELKAKCEQIEKRANEQKQVEEKKHTEEIQFLKRTNQQLKVKYFFLSPSEFLSLSSLLKEVLIYELVPRFFIL